jgi:hypothetical protein
MNKKNYILHKTRWFRQWSRKAYAIFLSIGKVVHIGHLKAIIAVKSLLKSVQTGLQTFMQINGTKSIEESLTDIWTDALKLQNWLMLLLSNQLLSKKQIESIKNQKYNIKSIELQYNLYLAT